MKPLDMWVNYELKTMHIPNGSDYNTGQFMCQSFEFSAIRYTYGNL
jgi:hypothetical protein